MDESPRIRFFSLSFLVGFGVGAFIGVAFGLMAFAVVGQNQPQQQAEAITEPTSAATAAASATPTPVRARTNVAMDVRIGPGSEFAAVGTIARGEALEIFGRDNEGEWIAIRFPPGSSARGWLPVRAIDNLPNVSSLAVVIPTPLPRTVSTPTFGNVPNGIVTTRTPVEGDDGVDSPTVTGTPDPNATPRPTGTSGPTSPDLAVGAVSRLPDGRVRVVITNKGNADLTGHQVMVIVADPTTRSETLRAPGIGLRAGASVTLESDTFTVQAPMTVIVTVDPSFSYPDSSRANNTLTTTLAPPTTPTPTPALLHD